MTLRLPERLSRFTPTPRRAGDGSPRRVVVVGGGIAGLATAALLASRGHSVDLLEKNDDLGGRVGSVERDGFRFDTGASWYLMPEVFEHFFSLLGTTAEAELDLTVLDPSYRVFFEGHAEPVDLRPDRAHNRALFERLEPGAGDRFDAYLRSAEDTYDMALRRFLYTSFDSPTAFVHPDVVRRTPALGRLLTRSLESHVAGSFTDNRLRQVLGYPAVFLGSSPSRTPSMYHLMSRLDLGDRVLYPQGGFTRLIGSSPTSPRSTARGCTPARPSPGSSPPTRQVDDPSSPASSTRHRTARAPSTPTSSSGPPTCTTSRRRCCPPGCRRTPSRHGATAPPAPVRCSRCWASRAGCRSCRTTRCSSPATGGRTSATSSARMHGCPTPPRSTSASPPRPTPPSPRRAARTCSCSSPCPPTRPSAAAATTAPGPRPSSARPTRPSTRSPSWAGVPDLRERIRVRHTVGPEDFATRYHAWRGGALGLEHTLRQSAFLRPGNASAKVDGLLYAGASTVPGVGLPMCLISAELVLKRLSGDRSSLPVQA